VARERGARVSVGEWLAATGAVLAAVLLGGLLFALVSLVGTVRRLRDTVERLEAETLRVGAAMQDALRDAEHEIDRVDALLTAAEGIGGRIDGASRLVTRTVTNPVVKVLALGTGTKQAVRRMRGAAPEAAPERAARPARERRGR
jgi:hypothetical protein